MDGGVVNGNCTARKSDGCYRNERVSSFQSCLNEFLGSYKLVKFVAQERDRVHYNFICVLLVDELII